MHIRAKYRYTRIARHGEGSDMGAEARHANVVSPHQLHAELASRDLVLLDVRQAGDGPDFDSYLAGHLPHAVFVDLDTDLAGVSDGTNGRRPLPSPEVFEKTLRQWGIDRDTSVVVYGAARTPAPARAWWLLRWAGVQSVRMLDGGLDGWVANGAPLVSGPPPAGRGESGFVITTGGLPVVSLPEVTELAGAGLLFDARPARKFTHPTDPGAGHIPGARSAPVSDVFGPDGYFKPDEELAELFGHAGVVADTAPAAYCGTGVAAALEVFALTLIGIRARLYVGSVSEWTADPSRPVER